MEELCGILYDMFNPGHLDHNPEHNVYPDASLNHYEVAIGNKTNSNLSVTYNTSSPNQMPTFNQPMRDPDTFQLIRFYTTTVIIPFLCVFGILGNICNILVVSKQHTQVPMDKSAYAVLIALAVSDTICCVSLLPNGFKGEKQNFFQGMTFWLVYEMYGIYIQNAFSQISTWFIVIVAISRHIAICFPLKAKEVITLCKTMVAVSVVTIGWLLLDLPYIWSYKLNEISCEYNQTGLVLYYSLDVGVLNTNVLLNQVFTYIGMILGFILPLIILVYCTFRLIKAVKTSDSMQKQHRAIYIEQKRKAPTSHVTVTLITIVIVFIILIFPSECLQIWFFFSTGDKTDLIFTVAVICNAFHTLNYAINFILYTVVNAQFRRTFMGLILCHKGDTGISRGGMRGSATSGTYV